MRNDLLKNVGDRLTRIRGERSQADFAPVIGLHKNTLGTYERGEREIGAEPLAKLAAQGWNLNWLITGEGAERIADQVTSASQPVTPETFTLALQLAEEALEQRQGHLPPVKRAELVMLLYDLLVEGLPEAKVLSFAKRAAA